jgi:pimeloyl-ACP methyl ester carboxylesterase
MRDVSDPQVQRRTRDVTARGVRMRVLEAGKSGQAPMILIHDFLSSHLAFDDVIDALALRFHIIAPDLPGFGESAKPPPTRHVYGVEAFAESIADLVAAYGLGRVAVIGHGLGGAVAMTLATHYAELVTRLALVDPLCYAFPLTWKMRVLLLPVVGGVVFKQLYGRRRFRNYFADDVFTRGAAIPHERIDRLYAHFNTPSARESAYAVLKSAVDTRPVAARITRITQPTLIMWGRDDRLLPASLALRLAREMGNARLELFDTGHSPHEERPQDFVFVATEFFEGKR